MLGLSRGSTLLATSQEKKTCRFVSAVTGGDPVQPTLCPENVKGEFGGRLRDGTCTGLLGRRAFSPMTRPLWASLPGRFPSMPVSDGSYYKTSGGNCQGGGFGLRVISDRGSERRREVSLCWNQRS